MKTHRLRTAASWTLLGLASVASIATSRPDDGEDLLGEDPIVLDVTDVPLGAVELHPGGPPMLTRGRVTFDNPGGLADLTLALDVFTLQPIEDIAGELNARIQFSWDAWASADPLTEAPFSEEYDFGSWGSSGTSRGRGFTLDCGFGEDPELCTIDFAFELSLPGDVDVDSLEFEPTLHFELSFDPDLVPAEPFIEVELL